MKPNKTALVNFLILLAAALLYAALSSPISVMTLASPSGLPVYRFASEDELAIQCVVEWDASSIDGILDTLKNNGVKITFAVNGEFADNNRGAVERITAEGHGLAVAAEGKNGPLEEVKKEIAGASLKIELITGIRPVIVVCGGSEQAVNAAKELGMRAVVGTYDLGAGSKLPENLTAGSIITVRPTKELEEGLNNILEKIKNIGLSIVPTNKMLYN